MNNADDERLSDQLKKALAPVKAGPMLKRRTIARATAPTAAGDARRQLRPVWQIAIPAVLVAAIAVSALLAQQPGSQTAEPPAATDTAAPSPGPDPASSSAVNTTPMPDYIPAGYKVEEVVSAAPDDKAAPDIRIRFTSGPSGFMELRRSASGREERDLTDYYTIEINGRTGWIYRIDDDTIRLVWEDGEYEYTLEGSLSEDEAAKVAGSIRIQQQTEEPNDER